MSFGYSIGDLIAVGELALRIYREYRDAPAQFAAIAIEVGSLHLTLKDVDNTIQDNEMPVNKKADLMQIVDGCKAVLTDLDNLLQKYKNIGKKTRWSWDRLRWHQSDIQDMRARIISSTGLLNTFNLSLTSSATSRIEKQLVQLRLEIQTGKREDSVITVDSMKAAQGGDEDIWREISRELEDAGITEEMINKHREFIAIWVVNAINSGQLDEQPFSSVSQDETGVPENGPGILEPEFGKGNGGEGGSCRIANIESKSSPLEEFEPEDESDEFRNALSQKITEFHRLTREAMESSNYLQAEQQINKALDVSCALFEESSSEVQEGFSILEELQPHLQHLFQQNEPIDPSKLDFCRLLYDFKPEKDVLNVDIEVCKGDLVAVISKNDPEGNPSERWKCRTRDGRYGYLPEIYLEIVARPGKNKCGYEGCENYKCRVGDRLQNYYREHMECAVDLCLRKAAPGYFCCTPHCCKYQGCFGSARPDIRTLYCDHHKCEVSNCRSLKSHNEVEEVDDDLQLELHKFCDQQPHCVLKRDTSRRCLARRLRDSSLIRSNSANKTLDYDDKIRRDTLESVSAGHRAENIKKEYESVSGQ
ncbi:uncharacterized protein PAC_14979 [Phialocephala subalpina]|uniref:Peroxisomal membrane protein PEX13 n=1 Tax=Phialocephala subalpina TaxID=576137 RepID=A0A1L7XJ61_9HELO|nr:uncharacterized protein PAC_14979 [Phialocephala subalpina]